MSAPQETRGERLRQAIIALLGTDKPSEFARISGIHRSTLYQILRDQYPNPGQSVIDKIRATGINTNYVMYGEKPVILADHLSGLEDTDVRTANMLGDSVSSYKAGKAQRVISDFLNLSDAEMELAYNTIKAFWEGRKSAEEGRSKEDDL